MGVRTRLTVAVTTIFAIASIVAGVLALRITEDRLLADARANAEQMLTDYVGRLYGGTAATPTVEADESTSFFFLRCRRHRAHDASTSRRCWLTRCVRSPRLGGADRAPAVAGARRCRCRSATRAEVSASSRPICRHNGEVVRFAVAPTPSG